MLRFLLTRRLLATIPVLLIVAVLVFLMLRLTPGDPAAIIAGDAANTEQVAQIRAGLGLNRPIAVQFGIWFGKLLSGNLGESYYFKMTVVDLIAHRIEPTLALSLCTIVLSVLVSVPLGVLAAWRQGGWLDRALMGFSVLGFSVPVFVLGYILIYMFSLKLGWLPVQGYVRLADGFWPFLRHLILPSITLSVIYIALIARVTRAAVTETLAEDYVRTARAKGLPEARVVIHHALANAAVPIVTVIGIGIALLDRRRGGHRDRVCHPRPRAPHRGCGAGARLPHHPGRDPVLLVRLRADQSAGRPVLPVLRSQDPLLNPPMQPTAVPAEAVAARIKGGLWRALRGNWAVMMGGSVLALLALIAPRGALARHRGPDAVRRRQPRPAPGAIGEITDLDGETIAHKFLMGPDGFGRDIYSRVIYGTRVSLIVGAAVALVSLLSASAAASRRAISAGSTAC